MSNKKRLYEVFAKVNRLNEWFPEGSEEMDDLLDGLEQAFTEYFRGNPKVFREGIPNELEIYQAGYDIKLTIDEQEPLDLEETNGTQLVYTAIYNFESNGTQMELRVQPIVNVEKHYAGNKTEFYVDTWVDPSSVQVQVRK